MELELNEAQRLLKENARSFIDKEIAPLASEKDTHDFPKELGIELLKRLNILGYISGPLPGSEGGEDLDLLSWAILLEELSRGWAGLGLSCMLQTLNTLFISRVGSPDIKRRFIPQLKDADKIICVCFTEPDHGSNLAGFRTTAIKKGGKYILNGTKIWISGGDIADIAIVLALDGRREEGGKPFLLIVEKEKSPFEARRLSKLGLHACPTAEMNFDECEVPEENVLVPAEGYKETLIQFQFYRAGLGTVSVGIAQASLDASIKYARERIQFGRPIASFQLIQNMIVEMLAETEAARFLTLKAWGKIDRGERAEVEAALGKAFATEVAVKVASRAIQIHGAYGLSSEYPVERYFRDARTMTIPDGTTEIMKLIVGRRVLGISAIE